jgi:hypothetical protein
MIKSEIELRNFNGFKNGREELMEFFAIRNKSALFSTEASAAKTIMITGSKTADIVISRELPMLPKVLPASRPDNAMKNFASARRYRKKIIFPKPKANGLGINTKGTDIEAISRTVILMYGVILIIMEDVEE